MSDRSLLDDTFGAEIGAEGWSYAGGSAGSERPLGYCFALHREPATASTCYFWAYPDQALERTMVVRIPSELPDGRTITFYGVIDEVFTASHEDMRGVSAEAQTVAASDPETVDATGHDITWARVQLLASNPGVFAPPRKGAKVFAGTAADARLAYGFDSMEQRVPMGVLRNGRGGSLGPAYVDLDFVLGANGAHVNITGMAGVAAKSSAMLTLVASIVNAAAERRRARPSDAENFVPVPVILSVKGNDMLWMDEQSRRYDPAKHGDDWELLGMGRCPAPFRNAVFLSPADITNPHAPKAIEGRVSRAYGWALKDVLERGLMEYLFSDADNSKDTFQGLIAHLVDLLTEERDGERRMRVGHDVPSSFAELLEYLEVAAASPGHPLCAQTHSLTVRTFRRRLSKILLQGNGVLVMSQRGCPPEFIVPQNIDPETGMPRPVVLDLHSLGAGQAGYAVQRFVVAAILRQMEDDRTRPNCDQSLRYLVCIDELNRYAPARAEDPITKYIEYVAAELRSMGVILFGAQQQASLVSQRVIQNCATRLVGRTEAAELLTPSFNFLSSGMREVVSKLVPGEMLLLQPTFSQPASIRMPMPSWAMRRADIGVGPTSCPINLHNSSPSQVPPKGASVQQGSGVVRAVVRMEPEE